MVGLNKHHTRLVVLIDRHFPRVHGILSFWPWEAYISRYQVFWPVVEARDAFIWI